MLKTRISRWKLDKKLKLTEMRTVIQIVAESGTEALGREPTFLVRGRAVPYSEVLRYFHRKGIPDPLNWLRTVSNDGFVPSSDVEVLTPQTSDCTADSSDEVGSAGTSSTANALLSLEIQVQEVFDYTPIEDTAPSKLTSDHVEGLDTTALSYLPRPFLSLHAEKVVHIANNYLAKYLSSAPSHRHTEPSVHHLTTHAIFAQRIQDGLSLLQQNKTTSAFNDFQRAFALIRDLLLDHHPMSLSLLLSIICDLDARNATALLSTLLKHISEMSRIELGASDPLTTLFRNLTRLEGISATNLALLIVRRAADVLSFDSPNSNWKSLYLRERLCDCLYHARHDYERATRRQGLLRDQEKHYGANARNVLWTLSNVADDFLQLGRWEEATLSYREVLRRSEGLEGYGRAKTRFAALEGLGRCKVAEAMCMYEGMERRSTINEGLGLLGEAEGEAKLWFEPASRRIQSVRGKILEVEALV